MIRVENLHKSFNDNHVLKGIDLEIKEGEVVAVIGPSGSGKSTLLRCLNFLEEAQKGIIEIDGVRINVENFTKQEVRALRKKTGMVFQHYNLFKNKTTLQNIVDPLVLTRNEPKDKAIEIAKSLLKEVGLSNKEDSYPASLSGGQQQRVGIARALALNPYVILFDEPTSSLDPELVEEVLSVMKALSKKNTTMIVVTHEMSFAREVADNVVFMADGQVIEKGSSEFIFNNAQNPRTRKFLSSYTHTANFIMPRDVNNNNIHENHG